MIELSGNVLNAVNVCNNTEADLRKQKYHKQSQKENSDNENIKKPKKNRDLSIIEQLTLTLDISIERAHQRHEDRRLKPIREKQFKDYIRNSYGINDW